MFPYGLDPEAVDIIDRLLHLEPSERLGVGPEGSENDFEALKSHPYFKGINFKLLDQTAPPVPADRFDKFFNKSPKTYKPRNLDEVLKQGGNFDEDSMELMIESKLEDEETKNVKDLEPKIIMNTVVKRKRGTFQKGPCLNLILQKKPYARLWLTSTIESDNKDNLYKKDIILYPYMKVAAKDKELFEINCPISKKKY